jgi:6-phosphogluconolactonase
MEPLPPLCRVEALPSDAALAETAGAEFARWLANPARGDRVAAVALSGGRIALPFYRAAVRHYIGEIPPRAEFFFADERWVSRDSPDSNHRLAREELFDPLKVPAGRQHPLFDGTTPQAAAQRASAELNRAASAPVGSVPALDLVLLGMGEDGHVASLFPGALVGVPDDGDPYLVVASAPKPPPVRLTLSYPVLAAAREVWVLVSGGGKEAALRESLAGSTRLPLGRVLVSRALTRVFSSVRSA